MPYTFAHPAAALPFRNTRLDFSAVVIGSMAPDFEFFLRMDPGYRFGHTLPGLVILTIPLGLAVLWLFHRSAKFAVVRLLPTSMQRRIVCNTGFRFGGAGRFGLLVLSVLAGAITHLVWDSFTHHDSWLAEHWSFLHRWIDLSWLNSHRLSFHPVDVTAALHLVSTLIGTGILVLWIRAWMKRTEPTQSIDSPLSRGSKVAILLTLSALAICGGELRASLLPHADCSHRLALVLGSVALLWWQLVVLGWWWQWQPVPHPTVSQS